MENVYPRVLAQRENFQHKPLRTQQCICRRYCWGFPVNDRKLCSTISTAEGHPPAKNPFTFSFTDKVEHTGSEQQTRAAHETILESQVNSFVSIGALPLHRSMSNFFDLHTQSLLSTPHAGHARTHADPTKTLNASKQTKLTQPDPLMSSNYIASCAKSQAHSSFTDKTVQSGCRMTARQSASWI